MQLGISTATFFLRENLEDCFDVLRGLNVNVCEVFFNTFCEYEENFGRLLRQKQGGINVHSVHVLNTNFEPQIYSASERVRADALAWTEKVMKNAEMLGSKYYTYHGLARLKRAPYIVNFEDFSKKTDKLTALTQKYGVTLCYENVHWAIYNYTGFYTELKKYCKNIKAVLDIKQAMQSGISYKEFIKDMGGDIATVHVLDYDENNKLCLPGRGVVNFKELFKMLKDYGNDPVVLIEAYKENYKDYKELSESLEYLGNIMDSI